MTEPLNLDTKQAAALIGVKPSTLRRWRSLDIGCPFVKLGTSWMARVFYPRDQLVAWIAAGCPMTTPARPPHCPRGAFTRPRQSDGSFLPRARRMEFAS